MLDSSNLNAQMASLAVAANEAVIGETLDGVITSWNTSAQEIFEYTAAEMLDCHIEKLFPAHLHDEENRLIESIRQGRTVNEFETIHVTKSGKLLHICLTLSPVFNSAGRLVGISRTARDITSERYSQRALELASERQRLAAEAGGIGFWSCHLSSRRLEWSESHKLLFGLSQDSANPSIEEFLRFVHPDDEAPVHDAVAAMLDGTSEISIDYRIIRVDTDLRWISTSGRLQQSSDLRGTFLGTSIDITQRRSVEEALRRANSSLEEFAYAAAHDLQEPLRNISLSLQELSSFDSLGPAEKAELLDLAISNANRMQTLIKDLLAFSRAVEVAPRAFEQVNANTVLVEAMANLSQLIHQHRATVQIQPLPAQVSIHHSHLLQLFQNLLANAIKYSTPASRPLVRVISRQERSNLVFSVSDNGIGIAPQYHKRIFGIFKRLDHSQSGNGIGLSVCKRIVEHYGGRIWVESRVGEGATFSFSIPHPVKPNNTA